jgi:hypothetical protein
MIDTVSAKLNVVLQFSSTDYPHRIERKSESGGTWLVLTADGWVPIIEDVEPLAVQGDRYLDSNVTDSIYQYRERDFNSPDAKYEVSYWVRCGNIGPVGYTFGNYHSPEGDWGEILTADDIRYTYIWGVDARATNGDSYTDEQIKFHINSSLAEMARRLNITIKKKRLACEPRKRQLKRGIDYDEEEAYYTYRRERVQRSGMITTRKKPVLELTRLDLLTRNEKIISLLGQYQLDKTKGLIQFFNRPLRTSDSVRAVYNAIMPYGQDQFNSHLFYAIDYVAGFENSDAVPEDLRAAIGKMCAIEVLNIVGDGLLAGFSSSSLSLDGVSESFSSTQSATSATYGARIKEYGDELTAWIKDNKLKFGHITMGCL